MYNMSRWGDDFIIATECPNLLLTSFPSLQTYLIMRILYLAKFTGADNDDEGAVSYALRKLGHEVIEIQEKRANRKLDQCLEAKADLMLFNKCPETALIRRYTASPKVFFYWDMIEAADYTVCDRGTARTAWMREVLPHVNLGFLTDGDYVQKYPDKLVFLPQGADVRYIGMGTRVRVDPPDANQPQILFTGTVRHGERRRLHVEMLKARYGMKFLHIGDGGPHTRTHGRELANLFANVKIVVAPSGPVTDNYCSNRVFLTLGLGGFLLHPYCTFLANYYEPQRELVMYKDEEDCNRLIDYYLEHEEEREEIRMAGHLRTIKDNTYTHRCAELLRVCRERIKGLPA